MAQALAGTEGAVVAACFEPTAAALDEAGVDRLVELCGLVPAGYAPDARAAVLARLVEALQPRHVLLPESGLGGADLGRRLAARLGEPVVTDAWRVRSDQSVRRARGGSADRHHATPRLLLLAPEGTAAGPPVAGEAQALALALGPQPTALEDLGELPYDPAAVSLEEAEFILAAGNGVRDWEAFLRLAEALGASVAGTRVVVDAGHLPRERQVGATGALTRARGYLALGISGAPQHLQGIAECEHVVAVNLDPHCDMMRRADLAVVGDVQAVVRALLARLDASRAGRG